MEQPDKNWLHLNEEKNLALVDSVEFWNWRHNMWFEFDKLSHLRFVNCSYMSVHPRNYFGVSLVVEKCEWVLMDDLFEQLLSSHFSYIEIIDCKIPSHSEEPAFPRKDTMFKFKNCDFTIEELSEIFETIVKSILVESCPNIDAERDLCKLKEKTHYAEIDGHF
jgi:hypothetical protein